VHIADTHAPDAARERVRKHFDEQQAADLTLLCATINLWNRLAIGTRAQPPPTWPKLPEPPRAS
jgi:alkylhydroperoxidase family enzyme